MDLPTLEDYNTTFVQRIPEYIIKTPNTNGWRTVKRPLNDKVIRAHLNGELAAGVLGKWYPGYAILDVDDRDIEIVESIRETLGLSESNSMLCSSESKDSYHVLIRPSYNEKPPTLNLLQTSFEDFCNRMNVEIYPSPRKCVRLPFGVIQRCLDPGGEWIDDWPNKLYWFNKLDEFDLSGIPYHQRLLPLELPIERRLPAFFQGKEYFDYGLQHPGTRHEGQFYVLYYLWRRNIPIEAAQAIAFQWVLAKHNGYSDEVKARNWKVVRGELSRQSTRIWTKYEYTRNLYPDDTHNHYNGWVTKQDAIDILHLSEGSIVKARFLFHLIKYFYPRRYRNRISVHSNLLKSWSNERLYTTRLDELSRKGIITRHDYYKPEVMAKQIELNWPYRDMYGAVLVDNRAPETIGGTLKACFSMQEIRGLLVQSGIDRRNVAYYIGQIEKHST